MIPGAIIIKSMQAPGFRATTLGKSTKTKAGIPLSAVSLLHDHRQHLQVAGWTAPELYRRNRSKGIAWLRFWSIKDIFVILSRDGSIKFQYFNETGKPITQTAFPRRRAGEKQAIQW